MDQTGKPQLYRHTNAEVYLLAPGKKPESKGRYYGSKRKTIRIRKKKTKNSRIKIKSRTKSRRNKKTRRIKKNSKTKRIKKSRSSRRRNSSKKNNNRRKSKRRRIKIGRNGEGYICSSWSIYAFKRKI